LRVITEYRLYGFIHLDKNASYNQFHNITWYRYWYCLFYVSVLVYVFYLMVAKPV